MKLNEIYKVLNTIAPFDTALDFDNVGILVGSTVTEVTRALLALDCTTFTAAEAADKNAHLLITHHPILLHGAKQLSPVMPDTAPIFTLIKNSIAHIAMHTNLDAASGGVNDTLCEILGITDTVSFDDGIGRIGNISAPVSLKAFADSVSDRLKTPIRICGDEAIIIKKVAVVGGAGSDYYAAAKSCGADVLVTGECKHHHAVYASEIGMAIIEAGHYETEMIVLSKLKYKLSQLCPDVEFLISETETHYLKGI